MGNYQSADIQSLNTLVTNALTSVSTKNFTANTNSCQNRNSITLETGPNSNINCALEIDQNIQQLCNLDSRVINTTSNEVTSDINNKMDQLLQSTESSVQGFLSAAASIQTTKEQIQNAIETTIQNSFVTSSFSECANSVFGENSLNLVINGTITCPWNNPTLKINQDQVAQSAATCFAQNIANTLANNSVINEVLQKMESTQSSKQGLDMASLLIIGAIILALIIGYVVMKSGSSIVSNKWIRVLLGVVVLVLLGVAGYYAYLKIKGKN